MKRRIALILACGLLLSFTIGGFPGLEATERSPLSKKLEEQHVKKVAVVDNHSRKQAIVIFVEGLSFADFAKLRTYPHVDKWLKQSGYAAMTIRPTGARTPGNAYLMLGSGGQAVFTERSGTLYQADETLATGETAGERMGWLSGSGAISSGNFGEPPILFPGIFRVQTENEGRPFTARIGLLGSLLSQHGIRVASYGNGDYGQNGESKQRHAGLFAMDGQGKIPAGDVSARTNRQAADFPYGLRSNYGYLASRLLLDRSSGLITLQLSDLGRLYHLRDSMEKGHFEAVHSKILADLDLFLDQVLSKRRADQMVIVTSALVNEVSLKEKSLLTPLLMWKDESAERMLQPPASTGGMLRSPTTRQIGLVSGLDVLPTILSWLGMPIPEELAGHVIGRAANDRAPVDALFTQVAEIDHIYQNRSSVMYAYVMLQIIILVVASLLWLWRKPSGVVERARRGIRLALLSLLFFPVLFLLEPLIGWRVSPPVVLGVIIMVALGGALILEQKRFSVILLTVTGLTSIGILLDGFSGAEAMRRSYLGYDPVIGARFYGLGNEYEGILIGSAILFAASLYEWINSRRSAQLVSPLPTIHYWFIVMLFCLILFYMAAPSFGTDAGGFLAGTVGFWVALFRLQNWRVSKKSLLLAAGGLPVGIALLVAVNLLSSYPLTHVGKVALQIVDGNWTEVAHIIQRKVEMNLRLIRVSAWSKVFVISLAVIGLLCCRPERYLRHLANSHPYVTKGFQGVVAGSIAGLLLNDSGIVTAATAIIFFVVPALYAALGTEKQREYTT